jgi:hypothetical protein
MYIGGIMRVFANRVCFVPSEDSRGSSMQTQKSLTTL